MPIPFSIKCTTIIHWHIFLECKSFVWTLNQRLVLICMVTSNLWCWSKYPKSSKCIFLLWSLYVISREFLSRFPLFLFRFWKLLWNLFNFNNLIDSMWMNSKITLSFIKLCRNSRRIYHWVIVHLVNFAFDLLHFHGGCPKSVRRNRLIWEKKAKPKRRCESVER